MYYTIPNLLSLITGFRDLRGVQHQCEGVHRDGGGVRSRALGTHYSLNNGGCGPHGVAEEVSDSSGDGNVERVRDLGPG